jgi:hypothetical protein
LNDAWTLMDVWFEKEGLTETDTGGTGLRAGILVGTGAGAGI